MQSSPSILFTLLLFTLAGTSIVFGQSNRNENSASDSKPLIVAHRGASADAPENTLPAFLLAWKQKADVIEGDFHLTKDGEIVCIHDRTTENYCDENLIVKESTLEQLKKLDVGRKFHKKFQGTRIPTLSEVFGTIPEGKKIYIEIKCGPEIVPELLKQIKNSDLQPSQLILISFQASVIKEFKRNRKDIPAFWLTGFKKKEDGTKHPTVKKILKTLKDISADGLSSSKNGITLPMIGEIQKSGYQYHVWTVDKAEVAEKFLKWGARSITTNKPAFIRKSLQTNTPPSENSN